MSSTTTDLLADARKLGEDAARSAASWMVDGNTDLEAARQVLEMMRNGDPAAYDYLPAMPNLSGEWADEMTPLKLYEEIGLDEVPETMTDPYCDAYEEGVSETFYPACEAELVKFCSTGFEAGTFTLTLELGNAEMASPENVADALEELAADVREGDTSSSVRDVNGNTVGGFSIAQD